MIDLFLRFVIVGVFLFCGFSVILGLAMVPTWDYLPVENILILIALGLFVVMIAFVTLPAVLTQKRGSTKPLDRGTAMILGGQALHMIPVFGVGAVVILLSELKLYIAWAGWICVLLTAFCFLLSLMMYRSR